MMFQMQTDTDSSDNGQLLKNIFRDVYEKSDLSNEHQVPFLVSLGDEYFAKAQAHRNPDDCIKAYALYNSALRRVPPGEGKCVFTCRGPNVTLYYQFPHISEQLNSRLKNVESLFFQLYNTPGHDYLPDILTNHLQDLSEIRKWFKHQMQSIEVNVPVDDESNAHTICDIDFTVAVEQLCIDLGKRMTEFTKEVVQCCKKSLSTPSPCNYAIIGFGSSARLEMTPYSDLEFGILLEEDQDSEENKDYFRMLARVFHFRVVGLAETSLPGLCLPELTDQDTGVSWYYDNLPSGYKFDGRFPWASKTPLGRKPTTLKPWKLELILTPEQMAYLHTDKSRTREGYHYWNLLITSCFIEGNEEVFQQFASLSYEKVMSMNPQAILHQMEEDMRDYGPNLPVSRDDEYGQLLHVKRQIYRLPTIIVANFKALFNIHANSPWLVIKELRKLGVMNETAARNLLFAVSIAVYVRLQTYRKAEGQSEQLSCFPQPIDLAGLPTAKRVVYTNEYRTLLHRMYQTVVPLAKMSVSSKAAVQETLCKNDLRDRSVDTTIAVLRRHQCYRDIIELILELPTEIITCRNHGGFAEAVRQVLLEFTPPHAAKGLTSALTQSLSRTSVPNQTDCTCGERTVNIYYTLIESLRYTGQIQKELVVGRILNENIRSLLQLQDGDPVPDSHILQFFLCLKGLYLYKEANALLSSYMSNASITRRSDKVILCCIKLHLLQGDLKGAAAILDCLGRTRLGKMQSLWKIDFYLMTSVVCERDASVHLRSAFNTARADFGMAHKLTLTCLCHLEAEINSSRLQHALLNLQRAYDSDCHPILFRSLLRTGNAILKWNRIEEAAVCFSLAQNMLTRLFSGSAQHVASAWCFFYMARVDLGRKNIVQAVENLKSGLSSIDSAGTEVFTIDLRTRCLLSLIEVHWNFGDNIGAQKFALQCYDTLIKLSPEDIFSDHVQSMRALCTWFGHLHQQEHIEQLTALIETSSNRLPSQLTTDVLGYLNEDA